MSRSRTRRFLVTGVTPDGSGRRPDDLIVEEPMTIQLDGTVVATTMRTPGSDFELAAGFCHTEGLLAGAAVHTVRYCGTGSAGRDRVQRRHRRDRRTCTDTVSPARHHLVELRLVRERSARRDARTTRPVARLVADPAVGDRIGARPRPGRPGSVRRHRRRARRRRVRCRRRDRARPRGRRSPQRRRQDRRVHACSRATCRPQGSASSSADAPASRWSTRRGRPASAPSSP